MTRTLTTLLCLLALPLTAAADLRLADRLKPMAFAREGRAAQAFLESERDKHDAGSVEWLLSVSWVARGLSFIEEWESAEKYAEEAYRGGLALVDQGAQLEGSQDLELALGAGIEVLGQSLAARGERAAAVEFLGAEREAWRGSPIETRIQKNYLLIGLEGKPMPQLTIDRFVGDQLPLETDGKVTLFHFWAHWCGDCKAQKPVLIELHRRYAEQGFQVIAPTRLYGYVAGRAPASPEQEVAYIEGPWQQQHGLPKWMPKPLANENFVDFGVSTTPTLVLVDREGLVRMYHPGQMTLDELAPRIKALL